ncbi:AAA-domain-containing protein [Tuber magnatum]|uniref:AAA-domain-containing protein n=1 Tax=Tuber magnatum TaxID=42249 RepID=A0A317SIG4_9PEZI|nr:AAA-domain-containing protein [Tuber magnatum]
MAGNRQSLTKGLERKVLAIIRRYIDELSVAGENGGSLRLSVSQVYQYITTDGSVPRQKKQNLEKMIEKALDTIRDEEAESDSLDSGLSEFEGLNEEGLMEPKESNTMNKRVVNINTAPASPAPRKRKERQPVRDGESVKRRKQNDSREPPKNISLMDIGGIEDVIEDLLQLIAMPLVHPETYLHTGVQPPRGVLLVSSAPHSGIRTSGLFFNRVLRAMLKSATTRSPVPPLVDRSWRCTASDLESLFLDKGVIGVDSNSVPCPARTSFSSQQTICFLGNDIAAYVFLNSLVFETRVAEDTGAQENLVAGVYSRWGEAGGSLYDTSRKRGKRKCSQSLSTRRLCYRIIQVSYLSSCAVGVGGYQRCAPLPEPPITPASGSLSLIQRFLKAYPDRLTEKQLDSLYITLPDFLTALPKIQPSSKREGFATVPDVTWADIGALESLKVEMRMAVVQPIKTPELYESVGITAPAGVLLWGPPGCGKTLLAKAVANESRANFISIQGPELLNKYVGESERAVRQVFSRARASIPCVIFFDELDALAPRRSDSLSESSHRVVNTLLTELDGLNDRKGIYVIGTTNRPNAIDPAILRPGRFDNPFFVDLPNTEERVEILKTLTKKTPLSDVDLGAVAEDNRCKNFSGADLAALVRKAAILALRRSCFTDVAEVEEGKNASGSQVIVTAEDFEKAFTNVRPSVLEDDREQYRELATRFDWGKTIVEK